MDDNEVNVILRPINTAIVNYIGTCKVYANLTEATDDLANFISTMTPILYDNMDSSIKANYYL